MKEKVSVIGGGTAGMIAARALAEKGISTRVYEQKAVIGHPIHASGILSVKGLRSLGVDYRTALTNTLKGANIHAGGKTLSIRTKDPVAVVLDRKRLNGICKDDAASAGAAVETRKRVSAAELDSISRNGIIIGADGAVSTVARHFSMGQIPRYSLTYKAEYNVSAGNPEIVDLFFDNRFTPGLFGWMCPNTRDILEVGIGVDTGFRNSKLAFERFVQTKAVADMVDGHRPITGGASIIPMARRERIVDEKRRVLLVGDAAGQVKATTGGGIIFGSNAALIAAESIGKHLSNGASLADYETAFMKKYGLEMRLHSMANKFYSSLSHENLGRIVSVSKKLGIEGFLERYGDMDLPSVVIKRFFLRGLAD